MQKILLLYNITCGYRNVAKIIFSLRVQIDPSNKDNCVIPENIHTPPNGWSMEIPKGCGGEG